MSGIILELQREATNTNTRVYDLLRKALLVAKKLKRPEIESWIMAELYGYNDEEVPHYRILRGDLKAHNPVNEIWMPVMFPTEHLDMQVALSTQNCGQSIAEIENLIAEGHGSLRMRLHPQIENMLMSGQNARFIPMFFSSQSAITGILDTVKTKILEWSLELEEQGVIGENLTFSDKEKEAAASVNIHVANMYNSQIQAATSHSNQTQHNDINIDKLNLLIQELENNLDKLSLDQDQNEEIVSEIETLKAQSKSPKPKRDIIASCLGSIKNIMEGAGGGVAAQGIWELLKSIPI